MITTVGQLAVNATLPPEMRDWSRTLDGPGVNALFQRIAEQAPEKYREIAKKLSDIGRDAAYTTGGFSFGLSHLSSVDDAKQFRHRMDTYIDQVMDTPGIDDAEKERRILAFATKESAALEKTIMDKSLAEGNPLALQIKSKARGNPTNLRSLRGTDVLYVDNRNKVIPVPITRSYSEGLSPAEYWAGTYGARKGVHDTKKATADAGFFSKQLNQAAHRLVVTAEDADDEDPDYEFVGLPVDVDDNDSVGGLLSHAVGGYARNTVITPKILQHLRAQGVKRILTRSPIAGVGPRTGGVYARDVGHRDVYGRLPSKNDMVGLTASQALSEKLTQGQLCLAAGTLVRMADWTVKRIEDIQVGDMVLGADSLGNAYPVRVTRTYNNGVKECVCTAFSWAKTKETTTLVSTREHKVAGVARRWHPTTELAEPGIWPVGEKCVRFAALEPRTVQNVGGDSEPYALLLGILLGDGCYTPSVHGVYLSCFDPTMIADTSPYLATLGLRASKLKGHVGYYRISQIHDTLNQCPITGQMLPGARNPALCKLLEFAMYGKYAHEKQLPAAVWSWDDESVRALISGFFAAAGSVYWPKGSKTAHINFGSTSLPMLAQIRELLRVRYGLHCSPISGTLGKRKRKLYSTVLTRQQDVVRFAELFNPPGIKRKRLARVRKYGVKRSDDVRYWYRKTQEDVGELPTFDIEVDNPDHLFVLANGLIVSNSSKHSGGVAGASSNAAVSGFQYLNQLVQVPKTFRGGATHAQLDGKIGTIIPAPQGGNYVEVAGQRHYVGPEFAVTVEPGQTVEAGDVLSEGTPNPAEIAKHKHIGDGRRYFMTAFRNAYKDAGMAGHRRNIELLARGLVDHVEMSDEYDEYNPEDVVPYSDIARRWVPRETSQRLPTKQALGMYLEKPVLHHSIGTQIKPSMLKDLDDFGVKEITVNKEPPPFKPVMVRAMGQMNHDPDFMTRFLGSNLQKSMLDAVHTGGKSDLLGTSFVPSLAEGRSFGRPELANRPKLF